MLALPSSSRMVSGIVRCPRYFRAAHAACCPLSPLAYASTNLRDLVANLGVSVS